MSLMEIVVIFIVAVLVLGPEKLPSTIVEIAKILKAVKKQLNEAKASIESEINISELKDEAKKYKEEIQKANDSIRKKLSFEEFEQIKNDLSEFEKNANQAVQDTIDSVSKDEKNISKREQFLKEKSENV